MATHLILILLLITKTQPFVPGTVKPISDNDNIAPKISDSLTLCCQSNESREHCDWWNVQKIRENLNDLGFRDALLSQKALSQTLRVRYLMLRCAINVVYIIVEVRRPLAFQP